MLKSKDHLIGIGEYVPSLFWVFLVVIAMIVSGCASPSVKNLSHTSILNPDEEDNIGGSFAESGDIRTIAVKMTGSLLSTPEIGGSQRLVRVAIAPIKNSTRYIIDKDILMKRLRIELNKHANGRVRFFSQGMGQGVRQAIINEQDDNAWDELINNVAVAIANAPLVSKSVDPLRVAVINVRNTNLIGVNADSFTSLLRAKIFEKAQGKIVFLARAKSGKAFDQILAESDLKNLGLISTRNKDLISGVDYFLGGEFISKSITKQSSESMVATSVGRSSNDPRIVGISEKNVVKNPNVDKYLNIMLINASTGIIPVEKMVKVERKMKSGLGRANYILTGEISALSKASKGGDRSDYIIMSFQLVEPLNNEIVWEDAYETKKVTNRSVIYR